MATHRKNDRIICIYNRHNGGTEYRDALAGEMVNKVLLDNTKNWRDRGGSRFEILRTSNLIDLDDLRFMRDVLALCIAKYEVRKFRPGNRPPY